MLADRLVLAPEVADALADGRAVVALESTLISHGLPYPQNLEVARASEAAVRAAGAVPATVAIRDGRLLVGLDEAALEALATAPAGSVRKAARPSLAAALAAGGWAATTVSATMIAAHAAGIRGLRDRRDRRRPSAARSAAGDGPPTSTSRPTSRSSPGRRWRSSAPARRPSSTSPATLEYLETRGVPVVAVGQADLPGFYARSSGFAAPSSVPDVSAAATLVAAHLGLGLGGGDPGLRAGPRGCRLPEGVARDAVERAIAEADAAGVAGRPSRPGSSPGSPS